MKKNEKALNKYSYIPSTLLKECIVQRCQKPTCPNVISFEGYLIV
jgi:hypothetical protein